MNPLAIENTIPVLSVADLPASLAFYRDKLQFKLDWNSGGVIASVSRDGHAIMLRQTAGTFSRSEIWIGCGNVEEIHARVKQSGGVTIVHEPINQEWAVEMRLADPDGNILWFGSQPRADLPFGQKIDL